MKSISILFILLLGAAAMAETPVSGTVEGKWTKDASPYHVTGNVTIAKGTTLRIDPGVTVIFDGPYGVQVEGKLVAGEEKGLHLHLKDPPPVKFTTDLDKNAAGWSGIKFLNSSKDNDLVNCTIEHVRTTGDGGGIRCDHSDVALTNSTLSDCATDGAGGGMAVLGGEVAITNCSVEDCRAGGQGGGIYGINTEIALTNCTIKHNTGSAGGAVFVTKTKFVSTNDTYEKNSIGGISLLDKSEGVWTNCTLEGAGIVCRESELVLTNGTIESGDETALSCTEHSSAVITNATLKGGKGLDKDETSEVTAVNVSY
jgi:hypothetical protein